MRSPVAIAAPASRYPYFHIARHAVGATTLVLGSAAGLTGAVAQSATPDQPTTHDKDDQQEIVVIGARSVINEKLGGSVQDAPQSINIVSAKTLQEESVTNLQDALKNVPGITLNAGEGTARGDTVNLRGFPAFNDFFLDGIRDAGLYTRDTFDLQTLEVLKGPSAILFGRGSTGGVINQVTKAAQLDPIQAATLQFGTNSQIRLTGDLDMPIGPSSAIRVNGMFEHSEVTDRDYVFNHRWGIAPTVAFGIGEPDSVELSWLHQEEHDRPDVGIPFVFGAPAAIPRNVDFGLLSDYFDTSVDVVTLRYKHQFNDDFSVTNTFRAGIYMYRNHRSSPNFGDEVPAPGTPLGEIGVGKDDPASSGTQRNLTDQLDLHGHFETGFLTHDLTIGIEIGRETNDIDSYINPFDDDNNWIPYTPILNPNPHASLPRVEPVENAGHTAALVDAAYLTDTIHIGQYVDLVGGARFDRFAATFTQDTFIATDDGPVGSINYGRTDNVTSPRAALVVKPTPNQSFYFTYGTSFDPSAEALELDSGSQNLAPVKAENYEVGAKAVWLDGLLTTTAALFRTQVDNAVITDPERPGVVISEGNQRVDGFELDASGRITPDWEILAGYIHLYPVTIGGADPANDGKVLFNTARNAVNVWTEYYLDDHWEVGTGGNFLGKRYADLANSAAIPSYFLWNGMVSYKVNDNYSVQMNITNILDRRYFDGAYFADNSENHVNPGAGRTFTFSARANF